MTETSEHDDWVHTDPEGNDETEMKLVAQTHYDPDGERSLTAAIVEAIADARDVSLTAVRDPVLYERVDVAAVERALFGVEHAGTHEKVGRIEFDYAEFVVGVGSDGWIRVVER